MATINSFVQIAKGISEKQYNGLIIRKTWVPGNAGSIMYSVELPNGKQFKSASWDNLKKQIKANS